MVAFEGKAIEKLSNLYNYLRFVDSVNTFTQEEKGIAFQDLVVSVCFFRRISGWRSINSKDTFKWSMS
jgi:hypothetical protein